jgi:hypothetical protein
LTACAPIVVATVAAAPAVCRAATTGTVQGRIQSAEGEPLKNANVFLEGTGRTTVTDKNGYFVFTGVQPGSYTVRAELVAFHTARAPVSVVQDQITRTDFALQKEILRIESKLTVSPVRRTETTTQESITARTEQLHKSLPANLYQFPGLIFGQPGVTPDRFGVTHIRGSDVNQVGYQVDGISITEPITNTFATTVVTAGLKNANIYTGGVDASYGGYTGGFINQVTQNGRDLRGGILEYTGGPGYGHDYTGANVQYGNLFGKFDVYGAAVLFQNRFPDNTDTQSRENADGLLKINYYADANNTLTAFHGQGFQENDFYQPFDAGQVLKYDDRARTARREGAFQQDHIVQGHALSYLTYKRNFNPQSFATYRFYRLYSYGTFHRENTFAAYQHRDSTQIGNQLDYTNQVTPRYRVQAGLHHIASDIHFDIITGITGDQTDPNSFAPARGYTHRLSVVKPAQTVAYVSNQIQPLDNKLTLDLGLRHARMRYKLRKFESFTNDYTDPRIGVAYAPTNDLVLRSSFTYNSQFPDAWRAEVLFPEDLGFSTARNPEAQLQRLQGLYTQYNRLKTQHAENFDLGVEKGFSLLGGSFRATLTGFRRRQYDLIQTDFSNFALTGPPYPISYNNDGTGHASGVEFKLEKRRRGASDLNGFLSYTNQVARATSSLNDTGYNPYFSTFVSDPNLTDADYRRLNKREFATSYDQRHTIALVANKRLSKKFEATVVLDAGSGFPFTGGAPSEAGLIGADAQHGAKLVGGASFTEVPVVLLDNRTLQPLSPVVGRSGWHYKFSINTNFYVNPNTWFFLNADNVLNRRSVINYATTTNSGAIYYTDPTAEYPQGRIHYGPATVISPLFLSFGIRTQF